MKRKGTSKTNAQRRRNTSYVAADVGGVFASRSNRKVRLTVQNPTQRGEGRTTVHLDEHAVDRLARRLDAINGGKRTVRS